VEEEEAEEEEEVARRGLPLLVLLDRDRPVTTDDVEGRCSRSLARGGDGAMIVDSNIGTPVPDDRLRALFATRFGDSVL